jgi:hypothetical protein
MAQFKTVRMTDLTPVSDVDNHAQGLEDAVVYAFGLPTGSELTGKIFPSVDVNGNITGIVRSAATPLPGSNAGPGWRSRDTNNNDEFLIMCNNGYLRVYENTGSQSSPVWTERNKMDLGDGKWDIGVTTAGLTGCMVYDIYNTAQDFRYPGAMIQWNSEQYDDTAYWVNTARSRITLPATGRYRFHWSAFIGAPPDPDEFNNVAIFTSVYLNGEFLAHANSGSGSKMAITQIIPGVGTSGQYVIEANANDYFELYAATEGWNDYAGEIHHGFFAVERIK